MENIWGYTRIIRRSNDVMRASSWSARLVNIENVRRVRERLLESSQVTRHSQRFQMDKRKEEKRDTEMLQTKAQ